MNAKHKNITTHAKAERSNARDSAASQNDAEQRETVIQLAKQRKPTQRHANQGNTMPCKVKGAKQFNSKPREGNARHDECRDAKQRNATQAHRKPKQRAHSA